MPVSAAAARKDLASSAAADNAATTAAAEAFAHQAPRAMTQRAGRRRRNCADSARCAKTAAAPNSRDGEHAAAPAAATSGGNYDVWMVAPVTKRLARDLTTPIHRKSPRFGKFAIAMEPAPIPANRHSPTLLCGFGGGSLGFFAFVVSCSRARRRRLCVFWSQKHQTTFFGGGLSRRARFFLYIGGPGVSNRTLL